MNTALAETPRMARPAEASPTSGGTNRLYFLDNLRAAVVGLVIVLHASITYMAYPPTWWYVLDRQSSLAFTQLVLLIDVPIMPIMFFIAGYFALLALKKRGARQFLKDKAVRVGIPWVLGVLFLAPPTAYIIYWSRGVPKSLWEFWTNDFWSPQMFQQSVYWFLGILMLLFALLAWVYQISPRLRAAVPRPSQMAWRALGVFGALVTALFLLVNLAFPIDAWSHNYLFVYQPVRAPLYLGYFSLGVYAYLHGWFTAEGFNPHGGPWGAAALLTGLGYLACRMTPGTGPMLFVATSVLFNAFCLSALMASVALFQRSVNGAGRFWHSQAANSYGIYYVHPLILYPLACLLVNVALPVGIKAPVLIVSTILLAWGVRALVLRRTPLLSNMF